MGLNVLAAFELEGHIKRFAEAGALIAAGLFEGIAPDERQVDEGAEAEQEALQGERGQVALGEQIAVDEDGRDPGDVDVAHGDLEDRQEGVGEDAVDQRDQQERQQQFAVEDDGQAVHQHFVDIKQGKRQGEFGDASAMLIFAPDQDGDDQGRGRAHAAIHRENVVKLLGGQPWKQILMIDIGAEDHVINMRAMQPEPG